MPGGSLFMRNPPLPLEVLYPYGIPEGISKYVFLFVFIIYIFYVFHILGEQTRIIGRFVIIT